MFGSDKQHIIAQMSATILAGLLANPTLTDGDKELNWDALCQDADQAAKHLLERAGVQ